MSAVVPLNERYNRNVLFTCLGSPGKPVIDSSGPLLLQPGDRVMLCSDGLWGSLTDPEITEVMAAQPVSEAVPDLVERALRVAGARSDNVTVLGVEWESEEPERHLGRGFNANPRRRRLRLDHSGHPGGRKWQQPR